MRQRLLEMERKNLIGKLITLIQLLVSVICIVTVAGSGMLPKKYLIFLIGSLADRFFRFSARRRSRQENHPSAPPSSFRKISSIRPITILSRSTRSLAVPNMNRNLKSKIILVFHYHRNKVAAQKAQQPCASMETLS